MKRKSKDRAGVAYDQWTGLLILLASGAWGMFYLGYMVLHRSL